MRLTILPAALLIAVPSVGTGRAADTLPQPEVATEATCTEITFTGRWQCTYARVMPSGVDLNWFGDGPILEVEQGRLRATSLPEFRQWRRYRLDTSADPPCIAIESGERRPALRGTVTCDGDELVLVLNGKMKRPFLPREAIDDDVRAKLREETEGVEMQRVLRVRKIDVLFTRPTAPANTPAKRRATAE